MQTSIHTHVQSKKTPNIQAGDVASADYSQQTELRFMVLSQLRDRDGKKKKAGREKNTELTVRMEKNSKKSRERGRQRLENDGHSSNSRSTWAVSGWPAASPGR